MKILIIQENGHHSKNRNFRECFCLQRAFESIGHEVLIWGNLHSNFNTLPDFNSFDLIINLENYSTKWIPDLSLFKKPYKILWSIDAHCIGIESFEYEFRRGKYQKLLHSTRDYVVSDYHLWFPNGFDHALIKPLNIEKTNFIGFCGNELNRKSILDLLEVRYKLKKDIFVIGDDMVRAVNSYRIHFNRNIANDVNYRTFETLGCGTVLCTNYNPQNVLLGLIDGVNCIQYFNQEDLFDKLDYYKQLSSNNLGATNLKINKIAKNGHELSKKHTFTERVKYLLQNI